MAAESWSCPACPTTLTASTSIELGKAIDAHLNRCDAEDLIAPE